ncbi:LysR family transcriptional regulator [Streptomyces sp. NPDC048612]|uniref:LysR family transcriptional regulator n=1 Tax=Streptomyces sp. NPDC048612 TaxID=3365579 RepID=UPI003711E37C
MIDWDLRKFRMLRELERQGTVTAAAQALSMTPSAVSQALAALGRQVGGAVVEPVGRRVRLTELAYILLEHGRTVFAQLEQAEAHVEAYLGGAAGVVRVGSFATGVETLLLPSLDLLRESRPTLRVEIREAEAADISSLLEQGDIDLGLSLAAHAHTDPDARFTHFPLLADPLDVALPAGHRLADKTGLRLADLADEPWVYGASGPWREITLAVCATAGFVPRAAHHAADWGVILSLVQAGLGVALIPRLVDVRRPGVRVRVLAADRPRRHVTGAVRRGAEVAPRLQEVVRCLRAVAEERRRLHPAM